MLVVVDHQSYVEEASGEADKAIKDHVAAELIACRFSRDGARQSIERKRGSSLICEDNRLAISRVINELRSLPR